MKHWRPIQSAPRDGTEIMAMDHRRPDEVSIVSFDVKRKWWRRSDDMLLQHPDAFTHWKPLRVLDLDIK